MFLLSLLLFCPMRGMEEGEIRSDEQTIAQFNELAKGLNDQLETPVWTPKKPIIGFDPTSESTQQAVLRWSLKIGTMEDLINKLSTQEDQKRFTEKLEKLKEKVESKSC